MTFAVRTLDFNKGYVIYVVATGRSLGRTWNTHRAPVAAHAARMNARIRSAA